MRAGWPHEVRCSSQPRASVVSESSLDPGPVRVAARHGVPTQAEREAEGLVNRVPRGVRSTA